MFNFLKRFQAAPPATPGAKITTKTEMTSNMGVPAARITQSGSVLAGEENRELQGLQGLKKFDLMRREAMVNSSLQLINLPILAAEWDIESEDEQVRDFLVEALFRRIDWDNYLRHCLLSFVFGFQVFEKVWKVEGGHWWLDSLDHRAATTIYGWRADSESGLLTGIEQRGFRGQDYVNVLIPAEPSIEGVRQKLVHLAYGQEGNTFTGLSGLRGAYMYWKGKVEIFKIAGIALERFALGVPTAEPPTYDAGNGPVGKFSEADKHEAIAAMGRLRAGEQAWLWNPGGWKFDILGTGDGQRYDPMPYLQYCDEMIALNVLGEFINLGRTSSGARSVGESQVGIFMQAEEALADLIRSRTQTQVIDPLLEYNFGPDAEARLRWSSLSPAQPAKLTEYLDKLTKAGVISIDEDLEDHVRNMLDLPPRPGEVSHTASDHTHTHVLAETAFFRPLRPNERFVHFNEVAGRQDDALEEVGRLGEAVLRDWFAGLQQQAVAVVAQGDFRQAIELAVDDPAPRETVGQLTALMRELFRFGRRQVREELQRQRRRQATDVGSVTLRDEDFADGDVRDLIWVRARKHLKTLASRAESMYAERVIELMRTQGPDVLPDQFASISDSLLEILQVTARLDGRLLVGEAFNMGRHREAEDQSDEIAYVEYSAILDGNVCEECEAEDRRMAQIEMGSEEYYDLMPPNKECLSTASGSSRCRCLYVYVSAAEREKLI